MTTIQTTFSLLTMKQKIQTLLTQLNHGLVEREATLKIALLTVLAGENLVLIGPPGTGKSYIARRIAESFSHGRDKNGYFEYLLTKFSTPEEIFGPLSITELKADRFKRNTAGYLPTVKIAFLDEIFKASSSILNALLTILNERIYHNGSEPQRVPMQALIAASNELPSDQEELSALYDRFLVRGFVDYVSQDNLPRLFEKEGEKPELIQLTAADLNSIKDSAEAVTIPPEIAQAMQRIWLQHKETFKEDRRESLSDRRLKKVIKLLCVSAATNGRSQVDLSDVFLLKDCLWNHQANALKVRDLILKTLGTYSRPVPQSRDRVPSVIHNELLTYEVAVDGKTLIPAQPQIAVSGVSSALVQASAKLGVVVKGFKGSGTAQDPLLIQTVEDLMDLSRSDIGMKGYYYRQTSDIDCSALSSWTDISFNGHYDGGGYAIKSKKFQNTESWFGFENYVPLFNCIRKKSTITNLKLEGLHLATTVEGSDITCCTSNIDLIKDSATDCTISACQIISSLIGGTAVNCTITICRTGNSLINGTASNCAIADCLAVVNLTGSQNESRGGIAQLLTQSSLVERCFVTGKGAYQGDGYFFISGIAPICDASIVRQCALGRLEQTSGRVSLSRIVMNVINASTLENNASVDSNPGTDNINGTEGKTVAATLFKQRYFEHTLGWDFDTVWQWDDKEDRPALRSVDVGAASQQVKPAAQAANMTDLLTQQISANIWL